MMDASENKRLTNKIEKLKDLLKAKQQVEQGKTHSMAEAKERIEKYLSKWK